MEYIPTIGLEIHAELRTQTKMFCNSKNDPDETRPNVNICPVCMGHPGTLPTINKEAVKHVLKIGIAIGGKLADYSEFDRKNYFYPDLPKGYQISQYEHPFVTGGALAGVSVTRVHLEEDTARSIHESGDSSLVDFNRAGVPLMELVTEPVIHSASEALVFARELQLLLRHLGGARVNMEKGEMRVEANISVSPVRSEASNGMSKLGTKVEVKNLNSFRALEQAIIFEIHRQTELLESGGKVVQETRGWSEEKGKTFSQRLKEESHDYRYLPDPDLPKLMLSEIPEFSESRLKEEMPELPWERRARYQKAFSLRDTDIELYMQNLELAEVFEKAVEGIGEKGQQARLSNYLTSDVVAGLKGGGTLQKLIPAEFAEVIRMEERGELSSRGSKDIIAALLTKGGEAKKTALSLGLMQKSDERELRILAEEVIAENQKAAQEFKEGKEASLQYLVGMAMRKSKGSANPGMLLKIFRDIL